MTPSGYSTRVDLYGFMWTLICVRTTLALVVHVFHLYDKGWFTVLGHWLACARYILMREEWLTFIVTLISWLITTAFLLGYDAQNYPIRAARLLEALGHPEIRTWQFNTLAAAATFQCLVLCRGTTRPIRKIDISAFLDMLIPDQRDVWKAWKSRVADRIIFEADIDFAPMVPTFPDERQRQLKDLLDEAQSAYGIYKRVFN